MRPFIVQIKNGSRVLLSFPCMAPDSCTAVAQHCELATLAGDGCYIWVRRA